ncbi:MAG: hypothetical protein JST26_04720 [Bacteroidetes bacterium]|nr:hypothetical protein [Bacteroidota bacterium]
MKYTILSLGIILALTACNNVHTESEKNIREGDDTVASATIVTGSKTDVIEALAEEEKPASKPVYKATGSEPGWFAEFYTNKLRLVTDYGKDSLILDKSFSDIKFGEPMTLTETINNNGKITKLKLVTENKPCTMPSGIAAPQTVKVEWNGKTFQGCGTPIE